MKTKPLTQLLIAILSIGLFTAHPRALNAAALTPRAVMEAVQDRDDGETAESEMTMILIDRRNKQRIRQLKNFRKDFNPDEKSLIFFTHPADVRDTAYLSYEWDSSARTDDAWLYLPALRRVKRIASDDESGAFMGSDFTYADINGLEIEDWDYRFVKQSESVEGHDTWVIGGLPKPDRTARVVKETGYRKSLAWVRKDLFMVVKAKYWLKKGKKIKYFQAKNIRPVDGIQTAHHLSMITTRNGKKIHASVIKIDRVRYNRPVDDRLLTVQAMQRGL